MKKARKSDYSMNIDVMFRHSSVCVSVGVSGPEELTVESAHSALENMFETLRGVSHARDHLKNFSSVYTPSDGAHQVSDTYVKCNATY